MSTDSLARKLALNLAHLILPNPRKSTSTYLRIDDNLIKVGQSLLKICRNREILFYPWKRLRWNTPSYFPNVLFSFVYFCTISQVVSKTVDWTSNALIVQSRQTPMDVTSIYFCSNKKNEKERRHDNISFLPGACYELRIHGREKIEFVSILTKIHMY